MPEKDKVIKGVKGAAIVGACMTPMGLSATILGSAIKKTGEILAEGNADKIANEADCQEHRTRIAIGQAKIVQEMAIAKRIETADEVEIEEYYDNNAEGKLGLKGDEKGLSLGISGNSNRVSKRIYKFKGYNEKRADIYEQSINALNADILTKYLGNDTDNSDT